MNITLLKYKNLNRNEKKYDFIMCNVYFMFYYRFLKVNQMYLYNML